jgi:hypothetical protein
VSHIDYLVYLADLGRSGAISVPLYLGVGVVLWEAPYDDDDPHFGFRVPSGRPRPLRRAPCRYFFGARWRGPSFAANDAPDDVACLRRTSHVDGLRSCERADGRDGVLQSAVLRKCQ